MRNLILGVACGRNDDESERGGDHKLEEEGMPVAHEGRGRGGTEAAPVAARYARRKEAGAHESACTLGDDIAEGTEDRELTQHPQCDGHGGVDVAARAVRKSGDKGEDSEALNGADEDDGGTRGPKIELRSGGTGGCDQVSAERT